MGENIVFISYFCRLPDPQRRTFWKNNDFEKIKPLYDSVVRLGLSMIIFYDNFTDKFIQEHSTEKIKFVKYKPKYNLLNSRWYCYLDYLESHYYDNILCIDCCDAEVLENPFPFDSLIVGSEEGLIKNSEFVMSWFRRAYGMVHYPDKKILNCGILGGNHSDMIAVLSKFKHESAGKENLNIDMAIFNRILYDGFSFKTGYPIHTKFGRYEKNTDCYIRHK